MDRPYQMNLTLIHFSLVLLKFPLFDSSFEVLQASASNQEHFNQSPLHWKPRLWKGLREGVEAHLFRIKGRLESHSLGAQLSESIENTLIDRTKSYT